MTLKYRMLSSDGDALIPGAKITQYIKDRDQINQYKRRVHNYPTLIQTIKVINNNENPNHKKKKKRYIQ